MVPGFSEKLMDNDNIPESDAQALAGAATSSEAPAPADAQVTANTDAAAAPPAADPPADPPPAADPPADPEPFIEHDWHGELPPPIIQVAPPAPEAHIIEHRSFGRADASAPMTVAAINMHDVHNQG